MKKMTEMKVTRENNADNLIVDRQLIINNSIPSILTLTNNTYINAATSDNTRKAYRTDIKHFIAWGAVLPATSEVILSYLHKQASILNPQTLERRLSALRQWHVYQGFADPTANPSVIKTLKGIKRIHGKPKKKAPGLFLEQLTIMSNHLQQSGTIKDIRNNAILLIHFAGAFRVSELVAIKYEHLSFITEGLLILVPRSKTDQENEGKKVFVPYTNNPICPVKTLKEWLDKTGISSGAIFREIKKNGGIQNNPLSTRAINYIIKEIAEACNLNSAQQQYSSHSLRRGFATEASRRKASMASIMGQGRWKSINTVLEYTEEGERFVDNAACTVFNI